MTELTVYDPQQDPDLTKMDGLITRHHSRWFHDTMKALKERGEMEMFKHLELRFLTVYWGDKATLPFSKEEFDLRLLELIERDRHVKPDIAPIKLIDEDGALIRMDLWLMTILEWTYARDKEKVIAWIRLGAEADAPEEVVEVITERYHAEWGEGATIKPERLGGEDVPFDETMGTQLRSAELTCFEELARKDGNQEKMRLIHKEYDRVGTIPVYLD